MSTNLPPRPNLDHLRRQAKSLLAALAAGEADAVHVLQQHLPSARGMSVEAIRATRFRLADAQSAIARRSGFASWPHLARHVDELRALEGTWRFTRIEIEGVAQPAEGFATARLLLDGDRFRTESAEAAYEGVFTIDVEAEPHHIDIEFVSGPEAGTWCHGIYRLDGETLALCLDTGGVGRPVGFRAAVAGHVFEQLHRVSHDRPAAVSGGTSPTGTGVDAGAFEIEDSELHRRLQGEWRAEQVVRDGQALPAPMVKSGRRVARGSELQVSFGGRTLIHALVRYDPSTDPVRVDYRLLSGPDAGAIQYGIFAFVDGAACFCMAPVGAARPTELAAPRGSGHTLSRWRPLA